MPWKETEPMQEKMKMITEYLDKSTVTELASKYDISRRTVYKYLDRYELYGIDGLKEYSRRPHSHPETTEKKYIDRIVSVKRDHMSWGPKKIVKYLSMREPENKWPAPSTAGSWLSKYDLVEPRKKRRKVPPYTQPFKPCIESNDVWSADYKGQFKMGNKTYCYPLTISDNASRYLFACHGLYGPRYKATQAIFENVFREYGLPQAIRTDNGVPFASCSLTGLSQLSKWWIELEIYPERIAKGKPQENGRHERMHRTLKNETAKPAAANMRRQQLKFATFMQVYNQDRPHEGIDMQCPGAVYEKSHRQYHEKGREIVYDSRYYVRKVKRNGEIKFGNKFYYLSGLLQGQHVGLEEIGDGIYTISYSFYPIARLDMRKRKLGSI